MYVLHVFFFSIFQNCSPSDCLMPVESVINKLLHHIGSNCCHRVHSDLLQSTLAQMLMRQRSVNKGHLTRVCDILEKAIREEDQRNAQCMLVVLQVMYTDKIRLGLGIHRFINAVMPTRL